MVILVAEMDPNGPTCKECHGTHGTLGRLNPKSPTFATNIPIFVANVIAKVKKLLIRYTGSEKDIVNTILKVYTEKDC